MLIPQEQGVFWREWCWFYHNLLQWLCLAPILTNCTALQGGWSGAWNKDKESSSQTLKLWLWPQAQHSASWQWTHQACMIQLRQEHESCVLPGIQLIWTQLNCSKNTLNTSFQNRSGVCVTPFCLNLKPPMNDSRTILATSQGKAMKRLFRMVTELGISWINQLLLNESQPESVREETGTQPTYQRPRAASQSRSWSGTHCNGGRCCRSRLPCWWCDAGRLGRWPQKRLCSPPPWLGWLTSDWTRGTTRAGECSDRTAAKTPRHRPLVLLFIDISET